MILNSIMMKATVGVTIGLTAWGGYKTIQVKDLKASLVAVQTSEARARGSLQTCGQRLQNLQEAAESNASIPDDLTTFDVPDEWLLPTPDGADNGTD